MYSAGVFEIRAFRTGEAAPDVSPAPVAIRIRNLFGRFGLDEGSPEERRANSRGCEQGPFDQRFQFIPPSEFHFADSHAKNAIRSPTPTICTMIPCRGAANEKGGFRIADSGSTMICMAK